MEHDYDDLFNYGDDIEYGEDAYWDTAGPRPGPPRPADSAETTKAGSKRKRASEKKAPSSKRQKRSGPVNRDSQPIIFMSREARMESYQKPPPTLQSGEVFALLPDWRERYRDAEGLATSKAMPPSMAKAVHEGERAEQGTTVEDEGEEDEGEGSWESEGDDEEGEIDFDPEQLRTILAQKMAEAGISTDEEESFMQSINDMLSGDGKGEAAMALLEKAQLGGGRKRKADSAVGLEPESKRGKGSE